MAILGQGIQIFDGGGGGGGGSVTGAASGTHLNGTIVYLGGNPLLEDTNIALNGFTYSYSDSQGNDNFGTVINAQGTLMTYLNSDSNKTAKIDMGAEATNEGARVRLSVSNSSHETYINLTTEADDTIANQFGIGFADRLFNIGFRQHIGADDPFVPLQYLPGYQVCMEYNTFVSPLVGRFIGVSLTAADLMLTFEGTGGTLEQIGAYRIQPVMFANIDPGGACHVQVAWTDLNFNPAQFDWPVVVASGDALYTPITIMIPPFTTIQIRFIVDSDGVNATVLGGIESIYFTQS